MTIHRSSTSARRRWLCGATCAALFVAAPLAAAQAAPGGFQTDPNIYSPDFWRQNGPVASNDCDYAFSSQPCQGQREIGGGPSTPSQSPFGQPGQSGQPGGNPGGA